MTANGPRMVVNIHPITGDGALGGQASCLLFSLKQAGCLLSQCLERLPPPQAIVPVIVVTQTDCQTKAGPVVTTRRIVAPEPGLVGRESRGSERTWMLRATCQAEPS